MQKKGRLEKFETEGLNSPLLALRWDPHARTRKKTRGGKHTKECFRAKTDPEWTASKEMRTSVLQLQGTKFGQQFE